MVLGVLVVLHLSLLSMNSLNQTQTTVFTILLHLFHPGDHITRLYLYTTNKWISIKFCSMIV